MEIPKKRKEEKWIKIIFGKPNNLESQHYFAVNEDNDSNENKKTFTWKKDDKGKEEKDRELSVEEMIEQIKWENEGIFVREYYNKNWLKLQATRGGFMIEEKEEEEFKNEINLQFNSVNKKCRKLNNQLDYKRLAGFSYTECFRRNEIPEWEKMLKIIRKYIKSLGLDLLLFDESIVQQILTVKEKEIEIFKNIKEKNFDFASIYFTDKDETGLTQNVKENFYF